MSKHKPSGVYRPSAVYIVLVALVSLSFGAIIWCIGKLQERTLISITDVLPPALGGEGCIGVLYDRNGKAHDQLLPGQTYTGTAPLFFVEPAIIGNVKPSECFDCPESISPALTLQGRTFYPVLFDIAVSNKWFRPGESAVLTATVSVSNTFSRDAFAIPLSSTNSTSLTPHNWFYI